MITMSTEVSKEIHDSILKKFKKYKKEYGDENEVSKTVFGHILELATMTKGNFVTHETISQEKIDEVDEDVNELKSEHKLTFESEHVSDSFDFVYYEKIPGR